MKKAYLIRRVETRVAEIYVVANSEDDAINMVLRDPQCIEDYDYECDDCTTCEDECHIEELGTELPVYDDNFNPVAWEELLDMIEEGGEE